MHEIFLNIVGRYMKNFVFYDFETTGTSPAFDQALQFAAIRTDENLNPIEEINIRCRLSDHILPSPIALSVTGVTPDMLLNQNLSHYEFTLQLYDLIQRWSPAIWTGYNTISFDENVFRQMFYQNLLPELYRTQTNGNVRLDLLKAVYACWGYGRANPAIPEVGGKLTSRLDTLAPHNGFNEHNAHDALGDVRATIFIAKLIRDREPEVWNVLMHNLNKANVKTAFETGDIVEIVERFGASPPRIYRGVFCGYNNGNQNQFGFFDLENASAEDFATPTLDQVKVAVEKSPKQIRTIDLNKMPLVFGHQNPTPEMRLAAQQITTNQALRQLVGQALSERYDDREEPELVEQQIYGGFYSNSDKLLLDQFHRATWDQRMPIIDQLGDARLKEMGMRLMNLYAPQFVSDPQRNEFWGLIRKRWSGERFYGESERNPGNTYASVTEDMEQLNPGGKFEVSTEHLAAYKSFYAGRVIS